MDSPNIPDWFKENGGIMKKKYTNKKKAQNGVTSENPLPNNINFTSNSAANTRGAYTPISTSNISAPAQTAPNYPTGPGSYTQPEIQQDMTQMQPQKKKRDWNLSLGLDTANMYTGVIAGVNALLPDMYRPKDNQNRMLPTYNPFGSGDGTQAAYKDGGKVKREPIYVDSPNDPRYRAYQDSLVLAKTRKVSKNIKENTTRTFNPNSHLDIGKDVYQSIIEHEKPNLAKFDASYNNLKNRFGVITPEETYLLDIRSPNVGGNIIRTDRINVYSDPKQPVLVRKTPQINKLSTDFNTEPYIPTQVSMPGFTPKITEEGWYSNKVGIPIDAEDISPLYNEDGSRKYKNEFADGGALTSQDRDAWERMQGEAYRQGFLGSDHSKQPGREFMQRYGVDPNKLPLYQQDFQNFAATDPSRVRSSSEGLSNVDDFYGHKTAQQRYRKYQVLHNGQEVFSPSTNLEGASSVVKNITDSWNKPTLPSTPGWEGFEQKYNQEVTPTYAAPQPLARATVNKDSFYTGEGEEDYSIDKIREGYAMHGFSMSAGKEFIEDLYAPNAVQEYDINEKAKDGKWIQKATASIKRRGTKGVCTGEKFGSSSCPPGSKRYNLAKVFKKIAKNRAEDGAELYVYSGEQTADNGVAKDGIHIKPSKRGTFTKAAKKRGKGVQEFASQVLANKENYSPAMVKKANFAKNASKWKHEDGGKIKNISPEDVAISKVLMERNRDKNFVQRAFDPNRKSIQVAGEPGRSTHLMEYSDNGVDAQVYPRVVEQNNSLQYIGDDAYDYAMNTGQYITTPLNKANMFSNYGYKHVSGMLENGGELYAYTGEQTADMGLQVSPLYEHGKEYDLDINEIKRLEKLGYKLKY